MNVLCNKGYVKRDPVSKLFSISSIIVKRLGKGTKHLVEIMTPEIVRLSELTGKTVELIVQDDTGHTWLEKVEGRNEMLSVKAEVGFKRGYEEFDCLTRIYFAFTKDASLDRVFHDSTRNRITVEAARRELESVRKERFAFDISGNTNGIRRYAAPVMGSDEELVAVISIAEAAVPQNPVRDEHYKNLLRSAADSTTSKLN
jgi:DNA-binding IclR family transcriptional regulator